MRDVAGKVAFITGGGSGMGLGMAQAFTAAGMRVVIADIRQDHLEEVPMTWMKTMGLVAALSLGMVAHASVAEARDLAFSVIVFVELFRAFAARSTTRTFWEVGASGLAHVSTKSTDGAGQA